MYIYDISNVMQSWADCMDFRYTKEVRNEAVAFARSKLGVPYAVDFEAPKLWIPWDFQGISIWFL